MKISRRGRVRVATVLWLAVGTMLIARGWPFFAAIASTQGKVITLAIALAVGIGKGLFVLSRSAARTAGFIRRRPEQDWFWFSVHPILYALIPLMIGVGLTLKHFYGQSFPALVAAVYFGIGAALIAGTKGFRAALAPAT